LVNGPEPSAQDILDKCNEAIAELTEEVNKKMKAMENYVDSSIAESERNRITNEYKSAFRLWANCVKEPTEELNNKCQRDSAKHVVSRRPHFTPEATNLDGAITMKQVMKLEAYMLAFRDYTNLVVMQLSTLANYYCLTRKDAKYAAHYCQQYADELISEATYLTNYAEKAIKAIKRGHWGKNQQGSCPDTLKCKSTDLKEGWLSTHTANKCECTCEISEKKQYCTTKFTVRVDGNGYRAARYELKNYADISGDKNFWAATNKYGKIMLEAFAHAYQEKNHAIMDKYWKQEVLDFVEEWKKAPEMGKEMKLKNPNNDIKPVLDEEFSPEYLTRLAQTGYTYSDLQRFHDSSIVEDQDSVDKDYIVDVEYPEENDDEDDVQDESNIAEFDRYSQM